MSAVIWILAGKLPTKYHQLNICKCGITLKCIMFCRMMLSYVYIPVLEKELDVFKNTIWNNHRGRKQKNKELPDGIPEHIYNFPQHYGATKCGIPVSDEDLEEVAQLSNDD